jgi:hypothetical protein
MTEIKDAFGYQNKMEYNYRFDSPIKTTDRNDQSTIYTIYYDASGERVLKSTGDSQNVAIYGETAGTIVHTVDYTGYVSSYFAAQLLSRLFYKKVFHLRDYS